MKVEKTDLEEIIQSLCAQKESSSVFISTLTCASLTVMFIRQKNCRAREDRPATPQPALRLAPRSRSREG